SIQRAELLGGSPSLLFWTPLSPTADVPVAAPRRAGDGSPSPRAGSSRPWAGFLTHPAFRRHLYPEDHARRAVTPSRRDAPGGTAVGRGPGEEPRPRRCDGA